MRSPLALSVFSAALAFSALIGCSNMEPAQRTDENPACRTIIEGFFHSDTAYIGKAAGQAGPAICIKRRAEPEILRGEIVRMDPKGIVFDPRRDGPFLDPDSALFPYEQILWAVGKDGKAFYGELPKGKMIVWDMVLEMENLTYPGTKGVSIELRPNERFSFCMPPGTFAVTKLLYHAGSNYEDETGTPPKMTVDVAPKSVNYVGDIYLDVRADSLPNVVKVKTSIRKRPGTEAASGMFGLLGAIAAEASKGHAPTHTLAVEESPAFTSMMPKPWNRSLFTIQDTTAARK